MRLKLPYPVSANAYWRSYVPPGWTRPTVYLSDEAKAYKLKVGWMAKAAGARLMPVNIPLEVRVLVVPKDRRVYDLDNCLKVLFDALAGVVWVNDKQITKIIAEKANPEPEPRVEIEVLQHVAQPGGLFSN